MKKLTFHLIGNAHLDPVWLWDWREGLNEGITTVRTILKLMERNPDMTFIRGESAIYEHVQKTDPESFTRIKKLVNEGRWDVVGGSYIQPDTNMPATETLIRQFTVGRNYFKEQFGRMPTAAWAADSFGHAAGLPEILTAAGMDSFAFTRPTAEVVKISHPAFWWEGPSGARVLGYRPPAGWYGCEGNGVGQRMDELLKSLEYYPAQQNVGCFYGVGNHGGGPTQLQLEHIRSWAKVHPEVEVIHSGLHRLFAALREEEKERGKPFPTHRGELNFCLRGCYSSVAKFKFPYRRTEAQLFRGERTAAIIAAAQGDEGADLTDAWKSVLFNSFHDILPGSSIERAFDDQLAHLGGAYHRAQRVEFEALNQLAAEVDTSVPVPADDMPSLVPYLVWNPHPHTYAGPIEIETSLDYRPLFHFKDRENELPLELTGPEGNPVPFQVVRTEHSSMPDWPWRRRVVFQAELPPMSWSVFQFGLGKKQAPQEVIDRCEARPPHCIENGIFCVTANPGETGVQIQHGKKSLLAGPGLSLIRVNDPWGSWGGMAEEKDSFVLTEELETWKITKTEVLESGPERSMLWVRFAGTNSRLDLTFSLARNREAVDVHARVLWNERSSRLKLLLPGAAKPLYDVPGAAVSRDVAGEVPGGRWVWAEGGKTSFGFASDALYDFACSDKGLEATVVRASRYANDVNTGPETELWRPAVDAGELQFKFLLTAKAESLSKLAAELEQPPVAQMVAPHKGKRPRQGSLFALGQENVKLLALKPAEDQRGWVVRFQELAGKNTDLKANWLGDALDFGKINAYAISSFRLTQTKGKWGVESTNSTESTKRETRK